MGFFAEEFTGPFYDFVQARYEVDIVSPKGGAVEFDGFSDPESEASQYPNDLVTLGFKHHKTFGALMRDTKPIADVDIHNYDALCVAGGGGPFESAEPLAPFAIRDGRLVTAQQQHSTALFSQLVIEALSE